MTEKRTENGVKNDKNEFNLDDILKELGDFGKFQIIIYVLSCIVIIITGTISLCYIFTSSNLDYRCKINECEENSSTIQTTDFAPIWLRNAVPFSKKGLPAHCEKFQYISDDHQRNITKSIEDAAENKYSNESNSMTCPINRFNRSQVIRCEEYVYQTNEVNIVNEFNIHCPENEWKLTMIGSIGNFAEMFTLPLTGILSDRYGRRTVLLYSMFLGGLLGLIKSFVQSYPMFAFMQIFEALLATGPYISVFVLGMEFVGPSKRVMAGTLLSSFYCVGVMLLGLEAMYFQNFRDLLRILYAPIILLLTIIWIIPESVRWLLSQGRNEEAVAIIHKAAKTNNIVLSDETLQTLREAKLNVEESESQHERNSIWSSLKSKTIVLRLLNCCFCFFVNDFVYFGLSVHSVALAGSKYVNFIWIGFSEFFSVLLSYILMEKIGRKWSLCLSMIVSGIACMASELLENDASEWRLILFMIGKGGISVSITVIYVYTTELFQTSVRQSFLSTSCTIGRLGSMIAPQTPLLVHIMPELPLILFGGSSILSGLLVLFLPDTLNTALPDTLEEAKNIGRKEKKKDIVKLNKLLAEDKENNV